MNQTYWELAPEWGFADSMVLWLHSCGWIWPLRLQAGLTPQLPLPPHPALFLPTPFPAIRLPEEDPPDA